MKGVEKEGREIFDHVLAEWRAKPYAELATLVDTSRHWSVQSPSGGTLGLEISVFWDGAKGGEIRVIRSVDDGGLRAYAPRSKDFIKR